MLDNEPEGGDRTGTQPDSSTAEQNETTPVRRTRSTRRRVSTAPADAAEDVPGQAPASARSGSEGTPEPEVITPVVATAEAPPKPSRRRRKATTTATADAVDLTGTADGTGAESGAAPTGDVGQAPPVKATRSRRRKAASPALAGEAAATGEATSGVAAATGEPEVTDTAEMAAEVAATGAPAAMDESIASGEPAAEDGSTVMDESAVTDEATPAVTDQAAVTDQPAVTDETSVADETTVAGAAAVTGAPAVAGEPATTGAPAAHSPAGAVGIPATGVPGESADAEGRRSRRRAALSAPTVLFMAPEPEAVSRSTGAGEAGPGDRGFRPAGSVAGLTGEAAVEQPAATETGIGEAEPTRRRRRSRRSAEQAETAEAVEPVEISAESSSVSAEPAEDAAEAGAEPEAGDETTEGTGRRRRRRGRRGRGRGKGTADDEAVDTEEEIRAAVVEEEEEPEPAEGEDGDGVTRRRRRRRRKGSGDVETVAEDGVPTVVKIREPRRSADEVQGVSGSTRLEAKRQRRRDGREQRRTRPPILTESEFLARREAVDRVMVIRQRGDRTQIAVLEDGVLVEHYVSRASSGTMAGNVYLGKVQNVLPSMEAAFVDVGRGRNAVLYAGEVNWDSTGLEGRARSIEQALRSGDSVLVQVTKDPIGHKGARLTSHIALSGRHLVYVPNGNASGISRKLPDTERKRLRDILKKLVPDGAGVIVRTAAEGASEDELARDVKRLQAQWEDIQAKAASGGAPVLLYEEPDLVIRVVRDLFNEDFRELVVQGEEAYDMVESYLSHVSPDLVARLRRHTGTADVFAERRIDEQILKALDRKVFLPSGGHLVIDRTEAMTVIDVNTGKYTGAGGNLEETVTRNNLEAAEEIVRQLRLRDLGGIVVIDFIDMVLESNRELVLRRLTECLGRDRTKHQVTEITSLGLVQMTRKRIGAGLLEAFSETCECCKGRGLIIHTEPVPEKSRPAPAGDKVKAVAAAATPAPAPAPASADSAAAGGRRRARRAAAERVVVEVAEEQADDTMGYDLSRYETAPEPSQAPESPEPEDPGEDRQAGSMRLASADDPDAIEEITDVEGGDGASGRRRVRRSTARRRTRP